VTLHFVVPGALGQVTGGYLYDKRIVEGLRARGRSVRVHELDGRFPDACAVALAAAAAMADTVGAGETVVIDGLALPAFRELLPALVEKAAVVALVHHPLANETGLSADEQARLRASDAACFPQAQRVIVTSPATAEELARYNVPQERIATVIPGTDPARRSPGSRDGNIRLLSIGSLVPRKGHDVLIRALAELPELPWSLVCAGSKSRDPATALRLRALCRECGLEGRITFSGEIVGAELDEVYANADLFVLASHHEGYGMVFAEALARGLPILATTAGAIPSTVPAGCGILVPPGDHEALAEALHRLILDAALREELARNAYRAGQTLPTWAEAAAAFDAALPGA